MLRDLYRSFSEAQRREVCFDWNHVDARGQLRSFIANHWQVTRPCIRDEFFSREQQELIHAIFRSILDPAWYPRFMKQLADDTKGHPWGADQSIAIFGTPGEGPSQLVICGRHLTLRLEGHVGSPCAFGGPILYGHQPTGFYEKPNHPGNVFWDQALEASRLAAMLDENQRARAMVDMLPHETEIGFRRKRAGLPVTELGAAQKDQLAKTLATLLEPFRAADRSRVMDCLRANGGIDNCHVAFARDGRMSAPHWDNWRIEGPAFVWHFRGFPHVHVWVHVADQRNVTVNARKGTYVFPNHDLLR